VRVSFVRVSKWPTSDASISLALWATKVMMPADLERLHKYMLEIEGIDHISENAGGG
jgi:hypothetical protein